jgi:hypothetical protein
VVEALAAKARSVTVGNGLDEGVELGPTVFRTRVPDRQAGRTRGLVARAAV